MNIYYRQQNFRYRSGRATTVTNHYQKWSQSSPKTSLSRNKPRRYQTVTSDFPYVNMSARDQVIQYAQSYEGWNFNSGNYLFTTDTK